MDLAVRLKMSTDLQFISALRSIDVGLAMKISENSRDAEKTKQLHEKLKKYVEHTTHVIV
jgi:formylmethanofuran dehydrogenase subunit B